MADTVFRVEVGANIMTSTATIKRDIENMLNKISQNPPTVVVGLQKDVTKRQIQKDLDDIFNSGKTPYGVTLHINGGSDVNGATGRAFKKDITALTKDLSRNQAAKITVHIDTNATQKAMMAELKKLNLGVTITPKDGSGGEKGFAAYNRNLQAYANRIVQVKALEKQLTNSSLTQDGRNAITQEIAVWTARAEAARTAALNTTYAKSNNIDVKQFEDAANAMEKMQKAQTNLNIAEKQQVSVDDKKNRKAAQDEYNKSLQKYITLMAQANKARARAITSEKGSPERAQYNQEASDLSRLGIAERESFLRSSSASVVGVDARVYTDTANAANKLAQSKYRLVEAQNAYNKALAHENSKDYKKALADAATMQASIYQTLKKQQVLSKEDPRYAELGRVLSETHAKLTALKMAQADPVAFDREVGGIQKVINAYNDYRLSIGKAQVAKAGIERDINAQIDTAISRLNLGSSEGLGYQARFDNLRKMLINTGASAKDARRLIAELSDEARKAGAMAETAGEKFSRMLGNRIGYGAIALGLMKVNQALRQVYTNVVDIDTGMTELKKVTDETDATYRKFLDNAAIRAKELGATLSNTVNATASFARLGYSLYEAAQLADAAVVYEHVGDEIDSIDEASNSVISTMQAFGVEAKDVMSIVDKFNQIGKQNCPAA